MTLQGILLFVALLVGVFGVALLSPATRGVGLIAFACLLGIVARVVQASDYYRHPP